MTHLMAAELCFDEDGQSLPAHRHPVLFMLDEFASLGRMEIIEAALSRCLGYGITAMVVTQDISQLYRAYGPNQSVTVNCNIRVCFPPNEVRTAEWISKQLGVATITTAQISKHGIRSGFDVLLERGYQSPTTSIATQHTPRPLLLPDEILALPKPQRGPGGTIAQPGSVIVLEAGKRAILGTQLLYWLDPELLRRAKIPAPAGKRQAWVFSRGEEDRVRRRSSSGYDEHAEPGTRWT